MISTLVITAMTGMMLAGCGKADNDAADASQPRETVNEEAPADVSTDTAAEAPEDASADSAETSSEIPGAPYFTKGVYTNYSDGEENLPRTYFYIFGSETYGRTEDGEHGGIGLAFDMEQTDGRVVFHFGGSDEDSAGTLLITDVRDGLIYGYFEDMPKRPLIFERLDDEDPDTFSGENYVNGPENSVYHDANGWSIRYDATRFEITPGGPQTFIVYTGESAGTNMITVTYTVDNKAEAAIRELGESWGDKTEYSDGPFPGAGYVKGYWAMLEPEEGGSGMYETAVARDYMDGAIIFELTGHNGDDEEMNMEVSDRMAGIIDSLTWQVNDFDTIIDMLSEDYYYAYADMSEFGDALLITGSDKVFDNGDGTMAATEATVYGYGLNANIVELGSVAGGGTATPLACKDHEIFYGGHNYMNKVHIDMATFELFTDEGEYFDEYEDATVVEFKPAVSK